VKVLDGASQKLTERPVGKHAWGLTLNDVTGAVYVARIENADLAAIKPDSRISPLFPPARSPARSP
jgi:hypothetical protein